MQLWLKKHLNGVLAQWQSTGALAENHPYIELVTACCSD
jgi:hypothetical protein